MEVTARTLREVEFREKLRGYNQDDVDEFLERVAEGVDALNERLRQSIDRANRAEQRANNLQVASASGPAQAGPDEDTLRRTLVLAQRTADMAIKEANEKAEEMMATAQAEARALVGEAEESARRIGTESAREVKAELGRLEETRTHLQQEVEALERYFKDERSRLREALSKSLRWLDENLPAGSGSIASSPFGTATGLGAEPGKDPLEAGFDAGDITRPRDTEVSRVGMEGGSLSGR